MRDKAVPFIERKVGINRAENGNEVVFESADGAFSSIGPMFFWWDPLESHIILDKGKFQIIGALIIKDVKSGGMAMMSKKSMGGLPGRADGSSLSVGYRDSMDGIGVVVIQDKKVVVATGGRQRETASLIRIGFDERILGEEHGSHMTRARSKWRG